jgi:hypothetical protein
MSSLLTPQGLAEKCVTQFVFTNLLKMLRQQLVNWIIFSAIVAVFAEL